MTIREEFEKWAVTEDGELVVADLRWMDGRQTYYWAAARIMWDAWKASRASLVIELPPSYPAPEDPEFALDDSHMDAYHAANGMRHACSKFIEAAGVKVSS